MDYIINSDGCEDILLEDDAKTEVKMTETSKRMLEYLKLNKKEDKKE